MKYKFLKSPGNVQICWLWCLAHVRVSEKCFSRMFGQCPNVLWGGTGGGRHFSTFQQPPTPGPPFEARDIDPAFEKLAFFSLKTSPPSLSLCAILFKLALFQNRWWYLDPKWICSSDEHLTTTQLPAIAPYWFTWVAHRRRTGICKVISLEAWSGKFFGSAQRKRGYL